MRITLNMQTSGVLLDINNQQENITQLSQQIASGVALSAPSDDPYAWSQTMNINQGLQEYKSILSGISYGAGFGQATSSALNQLSDLVSQAQQVAVSAQSETGSQESATLVSQVNGILQQAVSLANSQYGEQYIFGGTNTTKAPYSIDDSTGVVTYNGNPDYIQVKTSTANAAGSTTAVNLTGDDVFNYTSGGNTCNVLQEIWNLGQDIQNNSSTGISSDITSLNDAFNHVNDESAVNGATLDDLTSQQSAINVMQTDEESTRSNLDDVDVASATTKLSQAQTAYQAALQVAGILDNLDLASLLTSSTA
jgi:flagellar hook-associated protein 3 FlgL